VAELFYLNKNLYFSYLLNQTKTIMEQQHQLSELSIDSVAAEQLRSIAGWGKFLSIIGFIVCGLMILGGIFFGQLFSSMSGAYGGSPYGDQVASTMATTMTVVYVVMAIVFFIPTLFLFQASAKLKAALYTTDQQLLNEGLMKMKATFRFWGIITIIILSIYALIFIFAILGSAMK
jgi:hypothetical protein